MFGAATFPTAPRAAAAAAAAPARRVIPTIAINRDRVANWVGGESGKDSLRQRWRNLARAREKGREEEKIILLKLQHFS